MEHSSNSYLASSILNILRWDLSHPLLHWILNWCCKKKSLNPSKTCDYLFVFRFIRPYQLESFQWDIIWRSYSTGRISLITLCIHLEVSIYNSSRASFQDDSGVEKYAKLRVIDRNSYWPQEASFNWCRFSILQFYTLTKEISREWWFIPLGHLIFYWNTQ